MVQRQKITLAIKEVLRRNAEGTEKSPIFSQKIDALKVAIKSQEKENS